MIMRKKAMYLRKSRADDGSMTVEEVLRRHKSQLLELAAKNGHTIKEDDIFEEVVSGESLYMRPKMLKLLELVDARTYDAVYVIDIDRLGRGGMRDQGIILDTFRDSNTNIITPRKTYDLNDETDEELTEFEAFMARRELKLIKRRLGRGMERVTLEGGYLANPPFGYKRAWVGKIPTLEIIPEEEVFVKMIFDMYVNQGVGRTIIADTLTSYGIKPHRNGTWSRSTVARILNNETYIGRVVRGRKKYTKKGQNGSPKFKSEANPDDKIVNIKGIHPPIISEELFYKAQEIRAGRYHPSYRKEDCLKNPLSGLIKCKQCGFCLQLRKMKKNAADPYWIICTTKDCSKSTRFDRVEAVFINTLQMELDNMKYIRSSNANFEELENAKNALQYVKKEIEKCEKQMSKLHDFLEQEVYDIATFKSRSSDLKNRICNLRTQQEELEDRIEQFDPQKYDLFIAKIEKAIAAYLNPEVENIEKNNLLKEVVEKAVYYKAKDWDKDQFELTLILKDFTAI